MTFLIRLDNNPIYSPCDKVSLMFFVILVPQTSDEIRLIDSHVTTGLFLPFALYLFCFLSLFDQAQPHKCGLSLRGLATLYGRIAIYNGQRSLLVKRNTNLRNIFRGKLSRGICTVQVDVR